MEKVFGFAHFRDGQRAVIEKLLATRSVLAIFPTSGGKSLCYQLPALLLDGLTLVISPLIALMKDQIDFLISRGVAAARLDSTLDGEQSRQVFAALTAGEIKLLYISPERLGNERFLQSLKRWRIALLAVDEAHCISEWGHNFRPDYLKIAQLARTLGIPRILALTATATPPVARSISEAFAIAPDDVVQTGFYRSNLFLRVTPAPEDEDKRQQLLLQRLRSQPPEPAIVYVTLQHTADKVAHFLSEHGLKALAYHAGMDAENRHRVQDRFMAANDTIVVATIAFGMGLDKSNIRAIYHYNLPKGLESYAQEIGRAGRDGLTSHCELLACAEDRVVLENFTYGDTPTDTSIASLVQELLGLGTFFHVSIQELANRHDIRPVVIKTLMTYLELEGIMQATGPFYSLYRFQPRKSSAEILARFNPQRAAFLRGVFRQAQKKIKWFTLDAHETSRVLQQPRDRVIAALEYLAQQGDIELESMGVREGFRLLRLPNDQESLWKSLHARFMKREELDMARVAAMLAFASHTQCRTQHLLAYFGETHDACGHCDRCCSPGEKPVTIPAPRPQTLGAAAVRQVLSLRDEQYPSLSHPRQVTRFLCGLASPATTRERLRHHPLFAEWKNIPFYQALLFVEENW
ncbi:MAG: RecQ family ATP-dependent DNA helicase [Magnetococcales bacterium]|nr:RecQ family ATP-dependent DNA helicase [Magnetococcales bacterium]MBF0322065.1 RecQ family ATP-dependent DNA helicase [Magnetococcales bacterium]